MKGPRQILRMSWVVTNTSGLALEKEEVTGDRCEKKNITKLRKSDM